MISRVFRVLIGLVLACLAAGLTLVFFVESPLEVIEAGSNKANEVALLALATATQAAIFAAPFALLTAVIGEWRGIGSSLFYALAGLAIAGIGFLAQIQAQGSEEASLAHAYAIVAFLVTGTVAGLVYWACAGRLARRAPSAPRQVEAPPAGAA
jgi:hypothetical protein